MRKLWKAVMVSVAALAMGTGTAAAQMAAPYVGASSYAPAPAQTWDGIFVGAFGAWGTGQMYHTSLVPGNNILVDGWGLGASAGGNMYLWDSIIVGVEADIAWTNFTGSRAVAGGVSTHTVNWMGTARAVLGYDAGMFMPYVTGGAAFVQGTRTSSVGPQPNTASAMHVGYAVGAGVQMAVSDNVIVDLRYLYSEYFPSVYDWSGVGTNPTIGPEVNTITLGVKMPIY